jgi:hypothetical protein
MGLILNPTGNQPMTPEEYAAMQYGLVTPGSEALQFSGDTSDIDTAASSVITGDKERYVPGASGDPAYFQQPAEETARLTPEGVLAVIADMPPAEAMEALEIALAEARDAGDVEAEQVILGVAETIAPAVQEAQAAGGGGMDAVAMLQELQADLMAARQAGDSETAQQIAGLIRTIAEDEGITPADLPTAEGGGGGGGLNWGNKVGNQGVHDEDVNYPYNPDDKSRLRRLGEGVGGLGDAARNIGGGIRDYLDWQTERSKETGDQWRDEVYGNGPSEFVQGVMGIPENMDAGYSIAGEDLDYLMPPGYEAPEPGEMQGPPVAPGSKSPGGTEGPLPTVEEDATTLAPDTSAAPPRSPRYENPGGSEGPIPGTGGMTPDSSGALTVTDYSTQGQPASLATDAANAERELNRVQQFAVNRLGIAEDQLDNIGSAFMAAGAAVMQGQDGMSAALGAGVEAGLDRYLGLEESDREQIRKDNEDARREREYGMKSELHAMNMEQARANLQKHYRLEEEAANPKNTSWLEHLSGAQRGEVEMITIALQERLGRPPTEAEIAEEFLKKGKPPALIDTVGE